MGVIKKLGDLFVQVSAKGITQTNQAIGTTEKKATTASKAMGMLKTAIMAIGTYAVVNAIRSVINEFIDYTVKIDKFTKQTGIATDTIQKLVYAAEQEHGNLEALNKGLMNLTVRLGYAGDGLETYLRYFRHLGIEYKNADGTLRDTYDVFLDISDAVAKGSLSTEELASVMQLFGARSAKELIPLLKKGKEWFEKMGNEAEDFGIVLRDDVIKQGKAFSDQMTAMNAAARGLKYELAQGLLPALNFVIEALTKAAAGWRELIFSQTAKEIEAQNKLVAEAMARYKQWRDEDKFTEQKYETAIEKLMRLNEYWKKGITTTTEATNDYSIATENAEEALKKQEEAIRNTHEELKKLNAEYGGAMTLLERLDYLAEHDPKKTMGDFASGLGDVGDAAGDMSETAQGASALLSVLGGSFQSLNVDLLRNQAAFHQWAMSLVSAIAQVIIKLMAMATVVKLLEALGVPAGALLSLGQKFGIFQTPTGDMFAYKEGLDFGKLFFGGMQERFNSMVGEVSERQRQQPVNVIVHTGDPSTFVEFVANMPTPYKSKFHRGVTMKAEKIEE